jgi:hypothetical protein
LCYDPLRFLPRSYDLFFLNILILCTFLEVLVFYWCDGVWVERQVGASSERNLEKYALIKLFFSSNRPLAASGRAARQGLAEALLAVVMGLPLVLLCVGPDCLW